MLVAQAFLFFVAGFETSSLTIATALYELAQNQDIQDKLRDEITEHHKLNNGEWQYENIKNMPYLDAVFKGIFYYYLHLDKNFINLKRLKCARSKSKSKNLLIK